MEDLSGAACVGLGEIFDPDCHHHTLMGGWKGCWMCDEARDICGSCPVIDGCFRRARRTRENHMIMAGVAWTNGRPRDLRKRRA